MRFSIDGDVRFISHRETMRLLRLAMIRAGLPLRYSEGFNPRPRISLPLPRSVGMASDDELLITTLTEPLPEAEVLARLSAALPGGVRAIEAFRVAAGRSPQAAEADYAVDLGPRADDSLRRRVEEFLRAERVESCRETRGRRKRIGPPKILNLRGSVTDLRLEGHRLVMRLRATPSGTAKPIEVLAALGLPAGELGHTLRRVRVRWAGLERVKAESLPQPRASAPVSAGVTTAPPGPTC